MAQFYHVSKLFSLSTPTLVFWGTCKPNPPKFKPFPLFKAHLCRSLGSLSWQPRRFLLGNRDDLFLLNDFTFVSFLHWVIFSPGGRVITRCLEGQMPPILSSSFFLSSSLSFLSFFYHLVEPMQFR